MRSTVYHKRDSRVNDLIRRCKKSEIISLYNISAMMMFRVEAAHMQFDMLNNHRPSVLFHGKAEGVYLPASTGLLFPNMCDELDFRPDRPIEAAVQYALSDEEIATLAANGLFNYDWSCQGRVIGALLEIPCLTDYYAIANTPITFVEIQDRLSLQTSTRKTGYKTLVAAFLPYESQRHNLENHPKLAQAGEYNRDGSEIRKRSQYDSKAVGFKPEFADQSRTKASFVETAQARIQEKLHAQMEKADVLGIGAQQTSKQIADAVNTIKDQADKARQRTMNDAEGNAGRIDAATLDARLGDMRTRMAYEGAQGIPLERPGIPAESLATKKSADENDRSMSTPLTATTLTPEAIIAENRRAAEDASKKQPGAGSDKIDGGEDAPKALDESAAETIESKSDTIHENVMDSEAVAGDIAGKVMTRREKLAQRRRDAIEAQKRIVSAGEAEASKGLTKREADIEILDARKAAENSGGQRVKADMRKDGSLNRGTDDDILGGDVDIDELIGLIER